MRTNNLPRHPLTTTNAGTVIVTVRNRGARDPTTSRPSPAALQNTPRLSFRASERLGSTHIGVPTLNILT